VLIGCTFASIQWLVLVWAFWIAERAGIVGLIPLEDSLVALRGGRFVVGEVFRIALVSTAAALSVMILFLLLKMVCRKTWIAGAVLCLLWGAVQALPLAGLWGLRAGLFSLGLQVALVALSVVLLVRFGLLATVATFISGGLSSLGVFSLDPSSPLFGIGLFVAAVVLAIAAYGCWTSLAGPHTRSRLLDA
jgi:hypothetical protein